MYESNVFVHVYDKYIHGISRMTYRTMNTNTFPTMSNTQMSITSAFQLQIERVMTFLNTNTMVYKHKKFKRKLYIVQKL